MPNFFKAFRLKAGYLSLIPFLSLPGCLEDTSDIVNEEGVSAAKQSVVGESLFYGRTYRLQNGYNNWKGGYLDTRGAGCDSNVYCVSTASTFDRDSGSGTWLILSGNGKANGQAVLPGDDVYLVNQYGSKAYLDTRNSGCNDNALCVSVASSSNRDNGSGTWKLLPNTGTSTAITEGQSIHLLNGYQHFGGGFLDTRGAGCQSNLYCVSTSNMWNRDLEGTNDWKFFQQ